MSREIENLLLGLIGVEDKLFIGEELEFNQDITGRTPVFTGDLKDAHFTELYVLSNCGVDIPNIYRWDTRYGFPVYITDTAVLNTINHNLENNDILSLHDFLYTLLINHIGTLKYLKVVDTYIEITTDTAYKSGITDKQKEIVKALGLEGA